jgi:diacylglycerol kinase (ATP)
MEITIIVNPAAGNGKALNRWETFKKGLDFSYNLQITSKANEATEITSKLAKQDGHQLIIAFGGDGTAHEVIEGTLESTSCIVGVIGAGSGNDFGRGFYSFKTPFELNRYVKSFPQSKKMDIGHLQTSQQPYYFVNNSGIGFDAYIAYAVNKSAIKIFLNKFALGKLAYTYYLIQTLVTFKRFRLTVESNDQVLEFHNVWFATVSNQPFFGGGMKISPKSFPSDGLVELTVAHDLSRLKLLMVFVTVFFGAHTKFKEVYQMQAESFTLVSDQIVFRHTDGEFAGRTAPDIKDHFSVQKGKWNITDLDSS